MSRATERIITAVLVAAVTGPLGQSSCEARKEATAMESAAKAVIRVCQKELSDADPP